MKYLSDIIKNAQTKCFEKHGVFFAFSSEQFNKGKVEGVKYAQLGAGTLCPCDNAKSFVKEHSDIIDLGIAFDLKAHGKQRVIQRELNNHECSYTGDPEPCIDALSDYPITPKEIMHVFTGGSL